MRTRAMFPTTLINVIRPAHNLRGRCPHAPADDPRQIYSVLRYFTALLGFARLWARAFGLGWRPELRTFVGCLRERTRHRWRAAPARSEMARNRSHCGFCRPALQLRSLRCMAWFARA